MTFLNVHYLTFTQQLKCHTTTLKVLQVLHTRMRTESSCLNACLDSLTCRRGQVEDNTHYLFQCQLCLTPRKVLLDSIVPLLPTNIQCSTLLLSHGHSELTIETNNLLFENVYTYIKSTKRI